MATIVNDGENTRSLGGRFGNIVVLAQIECFPYYICGLADTVFWLNCQQQAFGPAGYSFVVIQPQDVQDLHNYDFGINDPIESFGGLVPLLVHMQTDEPRRGVQADSRTGYNHHGEHDPAMPSSKTPFEPWPKTYQQQEWDLGLPSSRYKGYHEYAIDHSAFDSTLGIGICSGSPQQSILS